MYLQQHLRKKGDKTYKTVYLAESYRKDGKVKKRYIANLSDCPDNIIAAIKNELNQSTEVFPSETSPLLFEQGKSFGGIFTVLEVCKRLGITQALGKDIRQSGLALFQIAARTLCQRSRNYAANEWLPLVAAEELLHLDAFNEDTLYANLDWLCENQEKIERKLFEFRNKNNTAAKTVYLYDVTSSYLEGTQNELANYGYNRDQKKGKMQIVIGLLCDETGYPISVEVFEGNTQDMATVSDQLKKLQKNFGIKQVIMVGDRGMIKSASIDEMVTLKWHYITAITTPQVKTLLKEGVIQLDLFEENLVEIWQEDIRYLLRRNPVRMEEVAGTRNEKIEKVKLLAHEKTDYLAAHSRASVEVALKQVNKKAANLKIKELLSITAEGRSITVTVVEAKLTEAAQLDGCYILKSNVPKNVADKQTLHKRYKDLAMVENAFRTMKQSFEEMQPIYVRKETRTRGHVLVCMLSYMIMKYIWDECKDLESTQAAIYDNLSAIHYLQYTIEDTTIKKLPDTLNETQTKIINKLKIKLPTML
ncbi:MAG TPA: IS1634 family transposase [Hanamia sp.]|nr:IS1634 family transposase [Hanamia sp.]